MGNQPSSPPPNTPPAPPPPPPVPVCDLECLHQKNLAMLKLALDNIDQESQPDKYEQARLAYYTELNGTKWLEDEKRRLAAQEIAPIITDYSTKYQELNDESSSNKAFTNLAAILENQLGEDKVDNSFLDKQYKKEKTHTQNLIRQNQLTSSPRSSYPWLFNLLCFLLVIGLAYLGFTKFDKLKALVSPSSNLSEPVL
jgi:hypothetical protein